MRVRFMFLKSSSQFCLVMAHGNLYSESFAKISPLLLRRSKRHRCGCPLELIGVDHRLNIGSEVMRSRQRVGSKPIVP